MGRLMVEAEPRIMVMDARRTVAVKFQLIAQYFQHRVAADIERIHRAYNEFDARSDSEIEHESELEPDDRRDIGSDIERDIESDDESIDSMDTANSGHFGGESANSKSLKAMDRQIRKSEGDKLKWTVIRNPELLLMDWSRF